MTRCWMGCGWMALAVLLLCAAAPQDQTDKPQDPPGVVRMTQEQQKTVKLQTARAERRPITEPVRVPGTVAFDEGHVARLRPYAEGAVMRLLAQAGDQVHVGQPLAELVLPSLLSTQESLVAARATMSEAKATVAVANAALQRGVILARDGSLARAEADRRRLVLAQAQATAEAADARMGLLQTEIARLAPTGTPGVATMASPINGVVVTVGITPGEVVSPTTEAFVVADLSVVLVQAQVPESSAALVKAGDPAEVHLASRNEPTWQGKIVALSAALDPQARTLPARIQLANPGDTLRVGMFVDVTLTSDRGRDGVVVPAGAVQRVGDKRVAFTPLGDGRFQSHDLTLGVEQQDWDEVRNGLNVGDAVVTQGSFELKALLQKAMLGGAG